MDFKIIILSVACFSCLVPSVLSIDLLTAKLMAKKAVVAKGAAVAKGALALKGAALAKGAMLAKGVLAAKGAAIGAAVAKGAVLAKGALAAKGALVAKGVLAAKGLLAAKKAIAAKGLMLAKGAAAALVAKGVAAKIAAVKGAAVLAKGAAAKVLATKAAAVKGAVGAAAGLAAAKVASLSKSPFVPVPAAPPVGFAALVPVVSPLSAPLSTFSRRAYEVQPVPVDPVAGIAGRIGQWAGAIGGALVKQSEVASDLASAMTRRVASASSPVIFQMVETPRLLYPGPVVEKIEGY